MILRVNGHAERLSHAPLTNDLIPGRAGVEGGLNLQQIGKTRHPQSASSRLPIFVPFFPSLGLLHSLLCAF